MDAFTNDQVIKHYTNKDIGALIGLKSDFDAFDLRMQSLCYVANVDDSFIQKNYKEVLSSEAHSALEGCSTQEVECYFSMKHRAVTQWLNDKEEAKEIPVEKYYDDRPETIFTFSQMEIFRKKQAAILAIFGGFSGMAS